MCAGAGESCALRPIVPVDSIEINYVCRGLVDSLTVTSGQNESEALLQLRGDRLQVSHLDFRWDYIVIYVALRFLQGGGGGKLHTIVAMLPVGRR